MLEQELGKKRLLGGEKSKNQSKFTLSEIAAVAIFYNYSRYKNFKFYYEKEIKIHLRNEFPHAPSYSRIVELKQTIFWFLALFSKAVSASCTGISILGSTSLEVCNLKRIYRHKTFKNIAGKGKTSVKKKILIWNIQDIEVYLDFLSIFLQLLQLMLLDQKSLL